MSEKKLEKVMLADVFEIVKKNINYNYSTSGENTGNIPLIACKKLDKGIAKYVDKEEYEGDVLTIVKHRDATAGYTFHHKAKLAWNNSVVVIKLKNNKNINLDMNSKLLTVQLCPNHLETESLKQNFLNEKELYIYI